VKQTTAIDRRPRQWLKLFLNHMDAWGVALIIAALALVVHGSLSVRYATILLAVAGAYWLGFAYNDYQDAPLDALEQEKGRKTFFVGAQIPDKWVRLALVAVSGLFVLGAWLLFGFRGIGVMVISLLVIWAYSGRPLRLKSRPGLDLLTHALFVESYPYMVTLWLLGAAWTRLDYALVTILLLASLSAQLEQQLADYELDAKTEPNFTTWLGTRRTLGLLRAVTISLALLALALVIKGTIPPYMIPFGLIAAPMLARRFVHGPGQHKTAALTVGTLAAGLLYAAVVLSVLVLAT
jgi:4-hydroxybenzoate polyprenyltransferase